MSARYAAFYAPAPSEDLWGYGSSVIGYDAATGLDRPFPDFGSFVSWDWRALTEEPRRYGFHATLKAPFYLAQGRSETELLAAASAFASQQRTTTLPALDVALLGAFAAIIPSKPSASLDELAAKCVRAFEPFRAPLSESDRTRRRQLDLSDRERVHLERWGYPFVFQDFRFHMTLTGPLPSDLRIPVRDALAAGFPVFTRPLTIDAIVIFRQQDRSGRFRVLERFPLAS